MIRTFRRIADFIWPSKGLPGTRRRRDPSEGNADTAKPSEGPAGAMPLVSSLSSAAAIHRTPLRSIREQTWTGAAVLVERQIDNRGQKAIGS